MMIWCELTVDVLVMKEKKMGPLIPIEYSEEEMAAVKAAAAQETAAAPSQALDAAVVKELIAAIPTKKMELFAHPVDWDVAERGNVVEVSRLDAFAFVFSLRISTLSHDPVFTLRVSMFAVGGMTLLERRGHSSTHPRTCSHPTSPCPRTS